MCGELLAGDCGAAVCEACWSAIRPLTPPVCEVCGGPVTRRSAWQIAGGLHTRGSLTDDVGADAFVCDRCQRGPARLVACSRAIGDYEGALRSVVHALKYGRRRSVAARLAALMAVHGRDALDGSDAIVPVPLHWRRHWSRGFNQARLLADRLGRPVWPALARSRATRSQVTLAARQRRSNVQGAFHLARRWPGLQPWEDVLSGKVVTLVDDVATTGATLDACAEVLRSAGAREVRAVTAARVAAPLD